MSPMSLLVSFLAAHVSRWRSSLAHRRSTVPSTIAGRAAQAGQATAEYALVLLGVAAIALLLAAWAAKSGKIADLFDAVVDQLIDKVG